MKDKLLIICTVLAALSLITLGVFKIRAFYIEERENYKKRVVEINADYDVFMSKVDLFETKRDSIYETIISNAYFENISKNVATWKQELDNYTNTLNDIENMIDKLKNDCDYYYTEGDVTMKCDTFKTNYETIVNLYVSDIEKYNKNIEGYNTWLKENNSTTAPITLYSNDKYKQIDYNDDGVYSGITVEEG